MGKRKPVHIHVESKEALVPPRFPVTLVELQAELEKEFKRIHGEFRLLGGSVAELHEKLDRLAHHLGEDLE
jgi:hypothetical protein